MTNWFTPRVLGLPGKGSRAPVDPRTVFQIGSTTKGFLATTMAIMVDRGKFRWDDRVVDLKDLELFSSGGTWLMW